MSALGTSGWKARQIAARRKRNHGKTPEERDHIRAIRKAKKERDRLIDAGELSEDSPQESAKEALDREPATLASEPEPEAHASGPKESEGDSGPAAEVADPADMGRDALIDELQGAGQRVHPASKDATLRDKVRDLRAG